jgi:hypothetical protein
VACWELQNERDNKKIFIAIWLTIEKGKKKEYGFEPLPDQNAGEDNCVRMGGLGCVGGKGAWLRMARMEESGAPPPQ